MDVIHHAAQGAAEVFRVMMIIFRDGGVDELILHKLLAIVEQPADSSHIPDGAAPNLALGVFVAASIVWSAR